MIETPAAALISAELAKEVDFFSIGTNDLSQYTLAIDRQNQQLEPFFDAHHPAILRLIEMTVQGAHAAGIWCGVCGELGADLSLTKEFVRMGMDELSVSPASILPLRKKSAACNFYSYTYFYITHENTPDNAQAVSGAALGVNALYSFMQNRF